MASLSPSEAYRILMNDEHCDFTIICRKRTWRVHKVFICAGSFFFRRLVKAGRCQADLSIGNDAAVRLVLEWIYCRQYMNPPISDKAWASFRGTDSTVCKALVLYAPTQTEIQPSAITDNDLKYATAIYLFVYNLANLLEIEGLRVYASRQFLEKSAACLSRPFLVELLRQVHSLTPRDDKQLRLPLFRMCIRQLGYLREHLPDAARFLEEVEPQGCFFADLAHAQGVRIQQLQEALDEHDQKLRVG